MIDFDNLAGYRNAHTYDQLNDLNETEWKFYFDLAYQLGSPILDVACGTGRFTIPLAERGFDLTGVDLTPEMLEVAKQKAERLSVNINWVHADARHFELGRKFRFIFTTGNSFQHFLDRESVDGLLRTIYMHLDQNGVFAFETRNPVLSLLISETNIEKDHKTQLEHYVFTDRKWKDESAVNESIQPFALRYFSPKSL
ncbi:class I SAM-dependent methyltransferase [Paenibacillus montanisoli]|uniref:Methyltransferase domain-containing protein n=1 Tax=Paenibacillus montanisoli TaxID=2081970 RepID=A0A328TZG4_9BACL|nr:class I SAM-dependent methyltransferase [Paenibacillus montanisoli]RAP75162.1 hypothetical protein DL346_17420 [Paenibacillus montanisoli]